MDSWLSHNVPSMLSYNSAHNGLLIVTFDESSYDTSNHIVTIMAGPHVTKGAYSQWINHYNVLRLIESNFGLPLLGSSAYATAISGVLH
jgi:acid phosphatase